MVVRALHVSAQLGREARAVLEQGRLIAAPLHRVLRRRATDRAATEPLREPHAVLFVHGFMARGEVFGPMRAHVEQRLPVRTHHLSYGPLDAFESVAARVAPEIDRLTREHGAEHVSLVGHSLGGLVLRWYLQELGGSSHVRRLITLATPHAGTRAARFAPGPMGAALAPGGSIVKRLAETRHRASHVKHVAVVAAADRMVTPPSSAAAIDDAEVCWIDGLGHNEALFDRRVFDQVVRALR